MNLEHIGDKCINLCMHKDGHCIYYMPFICACMFIKDFTIIETAKSDFVRMEVFQTQFL